VKAVIFQSRFRVMLQKYNKKILPIWFVVQNTHSVVS